MKWWEGLGKDNQGSRPRCVLLTDGNRGEASKRLTQLINFPDVVVSTNDKWIPYGKPVYENGSWNKAPAKEAELDKADILFKAWPDTQRQLQDWWLTCIRGGAKTPNWDIASTCRIGEKPGLLLIEAKAHKKELSENDKCGAKEPNRKQIGRAIAEANDGLTKLTGNPWNLSRDTHYQLSNRFAWSWKLASLGIPVVLVYLGFLNTKDMAKNGKLFKSKADWERALINHSNGIVDNSCWGKCLDCNCTPFIPLIRVFNQPFDPCA